MLKSAGLLRLGWRQFRRDFASGEARVLFAALVLAVFAIATVSFITDRAQNALGQEANRLLGGDVVLRADTPIEAATSKASTASHAPAARAAARAATVQRAGRAAAQNGRPLPLPRSYPSWIVVPCCCWLSRRQL